MKKAKIRTKKTKSQPHKKGSKDIWVKSISANGHFRCVAIQAAGLVEKARKTHKLSDEAAVAMGEALIGALLLASSAKAQERINLDIRGSGFLKQAFVDAYPEGWVRGFLLERGTSDKEFKIDETKGIWGNGTLSVLRKKESLSEQPSIGKVPLLSGHLAKDLTFYWAQSEQIPSSVGVKVKMEKGKVKAAGGFLVQVMPGAEDEEISSLEETIQNSPDLVDQLMNSENGVRAFFTRIFSEGGWQILEERPVSLKCECSKERVLRTVALVGREELQSLLKEKGGAEVECDFCRKQYKLNASELKKIISSFKK